MIITVVEKGCGFLSLLEPLYWILYHIYIYTYIIYILIYEFTLYMYIHVVYNNVIILLYSINLQ